MRAHAHTHTNTLYTYDICIMCVRIIDTINRKRRYSGVLGSNNAFQRITVVRSRTRRNVLVSEKEVAAESFLKGSRRRRRSPFVSPTRLRKSWDVSLLENILNSSYFFCALVKLKCSPDNTSGILKERAGNYNGTIRIGLHSPAVCHTGREST